MQAVALKHPYRRVGPDVTLITSTFAARSLRSVSDRTVPNLACVHSTLQSPTRLWRRDTGSLRKPDFSRFPTLSKRGPQLLHIPIPISLSKIMLVAQGQTLLRQLSVRCKISNMRVRPIRPALARLH